MSETLVSDSTTEEPVAGRRTIVIGAGLSGLATAVRLAESGHDVTVLESHRIGGGASTRNQGWLHSGAWFARSNPELARQCHAALVRTIEFSPQSLEPGHSGMLYLVPADEADTWATAWHEAGIPFEPCTQERTVSWAPGLIDEDGRVGFMLPDRACRFDRLLGDLATLALGRGVTLRNGRTVERFRTRSELVCGVETSDGERIDADLVVLAGNAVGMKLVNVALERHPGQQTPCEWVALKTHLTSVRADVSLGPFCIVDDEGFHHVPRGDRGVFGLQRWIPVVDPLDEAIVEPEAERLHEKIVRHLPGIDLDSAHHSDWAGTTMQAMHDEQIVPGAAPLPTVVDHGRLSPPLHNLITIFPGRASLWTRIAEDVLRALEPAERP